MTKRIDFRCDLCREYAQASEVHGIYWIKVNSMELRGAHECNTHICVKCWEGLGRLWSSRGGFKEFEPITEPVQGG